jgi:hypothetical protein
MYNPRFPRLVGEGSSLQQTYISLQTLACELIS